LGRFAAFAESMPIWPILLFEPPSERLYQGTNQEAVPQIKPHIERTPITTQPGARRSGKLCHAHPIHPLAYRNLGMFTVANVAAEDARAVLPAHLIAPTPRRGYRCANRQRSPGVALAGLARLARR
jgi:hypothetical protein